MVALHAAAAAAGLVAPALLGYLVQQVVDGTTADKVDEIALLLATALIGQTVLTWFARYVSFWLSERIFAELREDFMARVLALPLSTVERAGVGDLVSRTTADIDALARTVRFAVPETLVAAVTTILTIAAVVWVSPLASTGEVSLGGVPLVALPLEQLRQEAALVTQEQHVFVGSLGENLRLARPDADDRQLWGALEGVDAHDWATALPEGLETLVGAGGVTLTPAQTQQLALARLVLADPHTLVLDEATSLLDPRAARHLERSLASLLDGRTVVAIAHRLHTAHDADRVAVVEDGLVKELGSHHELLARGGSYAALWESWQT